MARWSAICGNDGGDAPRPDALDAADGALDAIQSYLERSGVCRC
jgi:hypothetical protein